ncbi:MAG: type II secretion system protein [Lentisphaeria bacterium]|nr:type II secretion system protein [Lentisphaeria bacterium]MBO5760605.1 type II secretion system protein [Lentisphaeria bacterium]
MKKRFFTLVELLTVIAIIAVLAGLAIPVVGIAKQKAKQTQARVDINSIEMALTEYEKDRGTFRALPNYNSIAALNSDDKMLVNPFNSRASNRYYDAIMEVLTFTPVNGANVTGSTNLIEGSSSLLSFNTKRKQYLKPAKTFVADLQNDPNSTPAEYLILDPWGRRYNIAFDNNFNGYIDNAGGFAQLPTNTRINAKVMIFSYGSEKEDRAKNYICSWKQGK